ncbi:hypothetical protein L6164_028879 [Bauhinia variegata]|uniref:Uncharacterized protein n=1 Tax=Bauhinia variegata TaxID=167791 RepID=A0ACB9L812_BAUVA|nr:hypothetical protein L6164_028879 [Bauhinia variegata]
MGFSRKPANFTPSSVNDVINRFLSGASPQTSSVVQVLEAHRKANVRNLNAQLTQISEVQNMEKKVSRDLNELLEPRQEQFWWASPQLKR